MSDLNRIDLNLLRVFDLLITEGSVSRVAKRLHLSQSTISHALSRLRRQFKDDLFLPVHGGMAPTEHAKRIAPFIRQAMLLLEQGVNSTQAFEPASSSAKFRIAGGDYIELVLLPVLMERIIQQAPSIQIEIESLKPTDYARELESRLIDIVIGFDKPVHLATQLKSSCFLTEQLVIVAPKPITEPFVEDRGTITADTIKALKFIYPSNWGHSQVLMDEWCKKNGVDRTIAITVTGFVAVPILMAKLNLVTALPSAIARYYQQQFDFSWYPIAPGELTYRHQLAWHPLRDKDPSLVWLKQQIIAAAETVEGTR
nr:LysR family transcriptional regulator [Endozoicomonas sp.]